MGNEKCYSRRISSEEAKKGYTFILRDKLSFFPPRGKPLTLCTGDAEKSVVVESYHCTCRGPQLPHDHYFIRWGGLRFGEKISITRDKKVAERYHFASKR
jgi:hypothetical protein